MIGAIIALYLLSDMYDVLHGQHRNSKSFDNIPFDTLHRIIILTNILTNIMVEGCNARGM